MLDFMLVMTYEVYGKNNNLKNSIFKVFIRHYTVVGTAACTWQRRTKTLMVGQRT